MTLYEKIKLDLKKALKEKDAIKLSTLRFLLSALHNQEIELKKRGKLTDEDVIGVIRQQVKQHKESIEAYRAGKRDDLVRKEEEEMKILNTYLPQLLPQKELEKIIAQTIKEVGATGAADFGKVMGAVMGKVKGRAEGKIIAETVKNLLTQKSA